MKKRTCRSLSLRPVHPWQSRVLSTIYTPIKTDAATLSTTQSRFTMANHLLPTLLLDVQPDSEGTALSVADHDSRIRKLVRYVREANERDLAQDIGDGGSGNNLLDMVDPNRNTISYLALLNAHKNVALRTRQLPPGLLDRTLVFLATFDGVQARYMGPELREVLFWLISYYDTTGDSSVIPAVGAAILQLDPAGSTFTSTHVLFVRLCLAASLPRQALPVLDKDIYNFPTDPVRGVDDREPCAPHESSATFITRSSGLSADIGAADVQEYHLLGAQIYIGLRQWERASLFLELVLASPTTQVATPFMIEAYKKLILLSLLTKGHPPASKPLLDPQAFKTIAAVSKAYETLGDVFRNRDIQRFNAEVDAGIQVWTEVSDQLFPPPHK